VTADFSDSRASTAGAVADVYAMRFQTADVLVFGDSFSFVVHSAYVSA
jgi:hypothetical protein